MHVQIRTRDEFNALAPERFYPENINRPMDLRDYMAKDKRFFGVMAGRFDRFAQDSDDAPQFACHPRSSGEGRIDCGDSEGQVDPSDESAESSKVETYL